MAKRGPSRFLTNLTSVLFCDRMQSTSLRVELPVVGSVGVELPVVGGGCVLGVGGDGEGVLGVTDVCVL